MSTAARCSSGPGSRRRGGSCSGPNRSRPTGTRRTSVAHRAARRRGRAASWRSSGCGSRSGSTRTSASSSARFRRDPLLGPLLRRRPHRRPHRRPWPWEALAWAIVKQLIESRPRGDDPAPDRRSLGPADDPRRRGPSRRPGAGDDRRPGAGRTGVDGAVRRPLDRAAGGRQGHRRRPLRPRRDGRRRAASCGSPRSAPGRSSAWASSAAANPTRFPAGDLMYLKLVGKLAHLGPPGDGRGGRGVLRAVRAVPRPRRVMADRRLKTPFQASNSGPRHQAGGPKMPILSTWTASPPESIGPTTG